ncbi:signal peptidase I [Pseudomonas aeruginosa]|uniref:signal peptidase I n=1 Tax=Pseudomonas aeruginosa TaxID=287 RepID=UPI00071C1B2C|nr:signal peptidase I [Pseudomonas aeruginosa]KSQ21531.1 signal peptidase I [Pseudomonas aeruginosa]RPV61201.1 signal peptidase I [Pseudomonas aeruginosa]
MSKAKGSYLAFAVKAVPLALVAGCLAFYLSTRFSVGIDPQENTCLPWRVFVIDKADVIPARGAIFAFKAKDLRPYFQPGTHMIKVIDGLPGDLVKVTNEMVLVNGSQVGEGLELSKPLKRPESRFIREEIVPDNKYWFMGKTLDSFDSRYWGYVAKDDLIGRAYPIW